MVSISEDAFGEESSGLDGALLPKTKIEQESKGKRISEICIETRKKAFKPSGDYTGTLAIVAVAGTLWGVDKGLELMDDANTKYALVSACNLDPSLGTTHEYKTERPDGTAFPHTILKTVSQKALPHIVFGDLKKPIHAFQDTNGNKIVDGKEELQTFATPEQAKQFLTEQVRKINAQND